MPPERQRRPGGGGAADAVKADRGTFGSAFPPTPQVLDDLGHRLPRHRARVEGAPRLARPSWHRSPVPRAGRSRRRERAHHPLVLPRPRVRDRDRARQAHGLLAVLLAPRHRQGAARQRFRQFRGGGGRNPVDPGRRRWQRADGWRQRTRHAAGAGRAPVRPIRAHQHPRGLRGARSRRPRERLAGDHGAAVRLRSRGGRTHDHQPGRSSTPSRCA